MDTLRGRCVPVPQPSELRLGVVLAVGRGTAVLDDGQRSPTERGRFWGFLFFIFTMGNAIGSPTVKCFRFVCEKLKTFRSANISLESSIRALFGDIFGFNIQVGVYETFAKQKHLLCQHSIPSSKIPARAAITGLAAAAAYIP